MVSSAHGAHHNDGLPNLAHTASNEPLHSFGFRNSHRLRSTLVMIVLGVLAFAVTFAGAVYLDLTTNVKSRGVKSILQPEQANTIVDPNDGKPLNIVLLGQDTRDGAGNSAIGGSIKGEHMADTTMIVQISADRSFVNLVSIPRDSIVNAPSCKTTKGTMAARRQVQFNSIFASAYSYGGDIASAASCSTAALDELTGLDLSLFVVVDFQGLKTMIDAIGGVDLCIPQNVSDPNNTGLKLEKGMHHLDGTTATQYARVRHGIGDGSDIMRTVRQQYLIKALMNQALSKNYVTNSDQLYQLVNEGIKSLQMSEQLANINTLTGLVYSLRNFSTSHLYSRTVPTEAYPGDPNRVRWASGAKALWKTMKENKSINQADIAAASSESSSSSDSGASSTGSSDSSTPSNSTGSTGATGTSNQSDSADSSSSSSSSNSSSSSESSSKVNPKTGLITRSDGTLVDPKTGGTVNPDTGIITDPNTGYAMGYADQYLTATVCAVPAQK